MLREWLRELWPNIKESNMQPFNFNLQRLFNAMGKCLYVGKNCDKDQIWSRNLVSESSWWGEWIWSDRALRSWSGTRDWVKTQIRITRPKLWVQWAKKQSTIWGKGNRESPLRKSRARRRQRPRCLPWKQTVLLLCVHPSSLSTRVASRTPGQTLSNCGEKRLEGNTADP